MWSELGEARSGYLRISGNIINGYRAVRRKPSTLSLPFSPSGGDTTTISDCVDGGGSECRIAGGEVRCFAPISLLLVSLLYQPRHISQMRQTLVVHVSPSSAVRLHLTLVSKHLRPHFSSRAEHGLAKYCCTINVRSSLSTYFQRGLRRFRWFWSRIRVFILIINVRRISPIRRGCNRRGIGDVTRARSVWRLIRRRVKGTRIFIRSEMSARHAYRGKKTYSGRWWTGDLNGTGDVGESEYGEKADIRERSGEGSIGDFNAIILAKDPVRPQCISKMVWSINCRARGRDAVGESS